ISRSFLSLPHPPPVSQHPSAPAMPGSLPFPTAALPAAPFGAFCRHGLRFCGLRREGLSLRSLNWAASGRITPDSSRRFSNKILAVVKDNRSPAKVFDYDLVIIGAGVGGHGAAIHAVEKVMLYVKSPGYDRQSVADHANNLPSKIQSNLTNSLTALGVDILTGVGTILGTQKVKYGKVGFPGTEVTARNTIIASGSVPFVPNGIEVDVNFISSDSFSWKLVNYACT
ncbi:hypothetical protein BHE74_00011511, partial [Ensete ventricosum]